MSGGTHTNQFWWELITNKSSNPVVLDNYDTNLHLKHTEPLAGWCTMVLMITKEREESSKRLQRPSEWTWKVIGITISAHAG